MTHRPRAGRLLSSTALAFLAALLVFGVGGALADVGDEAAAVEEKTYHCSAPVDESVDTSKDAWSFESSWVPPKPEKSSSICASHFGHHTFVTPDGTPSLLHGGEGKVWLVEQTAFSPADQIPDLDTGDGLSADTQFKVRTSLDGRNWTTVDTVNHSLVDVETAGDPSLAAAERDACFNAGYALRLAYDCGPWNNVRQEIEFEIQADEKPFRYIRVANPESVYTGLTGFLDHASMDLVVNDKPASEPQPATAVENHTLPCEEHIMERQLDSDDPCTFGGYVHEERGGVYTPFFRVGNVPGQWDAPSFFHTYALGNATLDEVQGDLVVRDWRNNLPSEDQLILVQASDDGRFWDTLAEVRAEEVEDPLTDPDRKESTFEASFSLEGLGERDVSFLRLVAEPLPDEYWAQDTDWPDRHPWAYLVDSEISVTGTLPSTFVEGSPKIDVPRQAPPHDGGAPHG